MSSQTTALHLSRLNFDPRSRQARMLLANPSALYSKLLTAFDSDDLIHHQGEPEPPSRGVLFRVEPPLPAYPPTILVQSGVEPDWSRLEGESLLDARWHPESRPLSEVISAGYRYQFRIRANPTISSKPGEEISPGKRMRGIRKPLLGEENHRAWITEKLALGATIENLRIIDEGNRSYRRGEGNHPAEFISILFEGYVTAADPGELHRLIRAGVGRGKAFGFGLLSLRG